MRVPPAQACTRSVHYSFDRSQTPTADPHGGRAALSQGPASERRRPHAASARARIAVPALAAGLLLVPHEDAYQCVRKPVREHGDGRRCRVTTVSWRPAACPPPYCCLQTSRTLTTHPSPHSSAQRLQLPRMHRILEVLWQHGGLAFHTFQSGRSGVLAAFSISHTLAL